MELDIMHIVQMSMTARDFKKQRLKKGYTQARLAREFDIDVITISRWERQVVSIPRLAELALMSLKPRRKGKGD
jgi:transcriptional regulator with XRE-family HTH domain